MTTYRQAGVDVAAGEELVASLADHIRDTWGPSVVGPFGSFAAGVKLPPGMEDPVVMMTMDGVGTKLKLAREAGLLDGIGFDLVAMCVDDLAAVGAEPIGFCDYLAVGRIDRERDYRLVRSIAEACRTAGCPLLGGETAEHPGVLETDQFDLAGAALGVVEEKRRISGAAIRPGDVILGLGSPNLRSNGFSLVRAVMDGRDLRQPLPGTDRPAAEVLCEPSVIYSPAVTRAARGADLHGMAHITGGGLVRNLGRVLPQDCGAVIDPRSWDVPAVFKAIQRVGRIEDSEMARTFNLGIGFCVILRPDAVSPLQASLEEHDPVVIGRIVAGAGSVEFA